MLETKAGARMCVRVQACMRAYTRPVNFLLHYKSYKLLFSMYISKIKLIAFTTVTLRP